MWQVSKKIFYLKLSRSPKHHVLGFGVNGTYSELMSCCSTSIYDMGILGYSSGFQFFCDNLKMAENFLLLLPLKGRI